MASIVSERYALSLYEVAKECGQVELFSEELAQAAAVFEDYPDYLKLLTTPSIPLPEKQETLKKVFGGKAHDYVLNFLLLLTEKRRIGLISEICKAYRDQYYFEEGIAEVIAVTASPMGKELQDKLRKKMCDVTGKKVILKNEVDPKLIGGIVVRIENRQVDTSVKTRLAEIAQQMNHIIA